MLNYLSIEISRLPNFSGLILIFKELIWDINFLTVYIYSPPNDSLRVHELDLQCPACPTRTESARPSSASLQRCRTDGVVWVAGVVETGAARETAGVTHAYSSNGTSRSPVGMLVALRYSSSDNSVAAPRH